jgi:uroporphyrinogen-III decarboxylase
VCGNALPIVGDLADTGLDCIAPLDPLGGFTVADARRALDAWTGGTGTARTRPVALMGGINTLSFIDGTPDSVAAEAAACIAGARGTDAGREPDRSVPAGFLLGSGCVVPRSARVDCLAAARDVARACRQDP